MDEFGKERTGVGGEERAERESRRNEAKEGK